MQGLMNATEDVNRAPGLAETSWCKMVLSAVLQLGRETRLGMLLPSACGAGMQRVLFLSHLQHVL